MNSFFKIAAVDIDARCNNVIPFNIKEMDKKQDSKTGRVFTQDDKKQAWETFMKITNSTRSRALPCCNPDIKIADVNPELLAKVQGIYTYARPIIKNGDLVELQLTKTPKAKEAGWELITPYIICKLSYALMTPGVITKSPEEQDVWVVSKQGMLLDCFPTSCPDSVSVDNLFGTARKDPEYTYIDDATVATAIKDGNVKYIRDYLFKYNNANQVLTHDDYGNRLVHLAAINYQPRVFELLVAVKANFNVRNAQGDTPLHLAVKSGNMDCIEELLKLSGQNIEINPKNNRGETPLMLAISYKPKIDAKTDKIKSTEKGINMIMIRYLYNRGASVLDKDAFGNNMIHIIILYMAPNREMSDAVKFMLGKGVSAEQKNNAGITPLMLTADKLKETGISKQSAADMGHGVHERDIDNYTPEQVELMEIQTLLFNDIIRNNPDKYNKFISIADVPEGAPIEILDHHCVSATGQIIDKNIETAEECQATQDGNWVKIKEPSTKVKIDLIPESKRFIDAIPEKELYYPKIQPSYDAVPLPSAIQELNNSVRQEMTTTTTVPITASINNANNKKSNNESSNNSNNSNNTGDGTNNSTTKEGFHPALLIAGGAHHIMGTLLPAAGHHTLGSLSDLTSEYIKKTLYFEPPIDMDNLSSQNRPNINKPKPDNQSKLLNAEIAGKKLKVSNEHPPVKSQLIMEREAFNALKLTPTAKNYKLFLADNWMMITTFILLAIVLVLYISNGMSIKK